MEMWAQDAAAMYGYAASSAVATPAGTQQSTLGQLISAMPNALQSLASPAASGPGLSSIFDGWNIFAPGSRSSSSGLSGLL